MALKAKTEDSATRRTRSQAAPDWTHTQTLILINEIAAVESDCHDALSYYQKWKIIADNCAALDVNRTLDQCRRKWDSLFAYYNAIKRWQADHSGDYWSTVGRRMEVPEEFDREVFDAVDDVVRAQVERTDLDPDAVVEDADADPLGVIAPPLMRKQSHQLTPQKRQIEAKSDKKIGSVEVMASQLEENAVSMEIMATKLGKKAGTVEVMATQPRAKADSPEVMATQLREQAEMVLAILEGKLGDNKDHTQSNLRQGSGSCVNLARRQGDKLIDSFSVIASTLDQLCKVAPH